MVRFDLPGCGLSEPDRTGRFTSQLILISPDGFASPGFEYDKAPRIPPILQLMKYFLPRALLRTNLAGAYARFRYWPGSWRPP